MVKNYVPSQGDIVYLDFDPTKGHEQKRQRPAIVVSNKVFNLNTGLALLCPISSNIKEFPTHYILEDSKKIKGSVFCEHLRSINYNYRRIKFIEKASDNDIISVLTLIGACI